MSQTREPHLFFGVAAAFALSFGCSEESDENPGGAMPSFSVEGTWEGTAIDDDTALDLSLHLDNDGGDGFDLAGTIDIEGIGALIFDGAFVDPGPGASRATMIDAEDGAGYLYTLGGSFSSKRMDMGHLTTTNPALDVDLALLEVTLTRME